ncbi:MAG TPA: oxidoreductase [Myxococcota bacterium]|nr:oxidoreductase [Myxococcota bacterium]HND29498.1 oxidoreductase [Myxococcota bacterium]HNH46137.1 oxidoreductase [Myxococcota bacterium]
MNSSRVVLITGCSSGIGKSTALHLQKAGWTVYATARKVKDLDELAAAGCRTLALDVCSEESMVAAVAAIEAEHGAVGVLINNAGYSQSGALEALPMERVRAQFETNVFGMIRLCQLVLPGMRRQKWGKIVNISSMGGKLTFPGGGIYHASKHAVEALSDALRFEVKAFGVDVIVIQPGLIKTGFAEAVATGMNFPDKIPEYAEFHKKVSQATKDVYEKGPLAPLGGVPEDVARTIEKAINAKSPRARYPVTWSADVLLAQRRWMSDAMWDFFLKQNFPAPG